MSDKRGEVDRMKLERKRARQMEEGFWAPRLWNDLLEKRCIFFQSQLKFHTSIFATSCSFPRPKIKKKKRRREIKHGYDLYYEPRNKKVITIFKKLDFLCSIQILRS